MKKSDIPNLKIGDKIKVNTGKGIKEYEIYDIRSNTITKKAIFINDLEWIFPSQIVIDEFEINVNVKILENICKYCEDKAIYDKLGSYGDFYYKIKKLLKSC